MSTTVAPLALTEQTTALDRLRGFFTNLATQINQITPVDVEPILAFQVCDLQTKQQASAYRKQIDKHQKSIESLLKEPTDVAFKLHRSFTGLRNMLTADDDAALKHLDKQVSDFVVAEDRRRLELERELRAQQEVAAKQAQADAEAARQQALLEALPFLDEPEPLPVVPEVIVHAPVTIPDSFAQDKVNKPWSAEVTDLKALCMAVAQGACDPEAIQVNQVFLNNAARLYKQKLSEHFPGVVGVQKQRVRY